MFDPMIPYPSPHSFRTNHTYNYDSTNCLKYRESMSWKLGQLSLFNCISSSSLLTKKQQNHNNDTNKWYTSNHHYNTSTAISLSSHHYHQIEFISTYYDDKIIIAAHDSLSLDILSSSSSSCSDTPLVSNQSLPSSQKIQKMKSIPNDCIVIGCNNGQYHIYSMDNNHNKKPIYSSRATTSQTNNSTTITSTKKSLWDFQTISGTNDVVAIYGNINTNTIHGMDSRCHPQQQQSFRFSPQQQPQYEMSCLTFTSNHQIAIGSNTHHNKKNILSFYDIRMLPSSCHTAKCCQQYTIQSNHTNVQISQTSSLECNDNDDHDNDAYSIAHLSSNPDTDSICISMRSSNNNTINHNGRNGIVWTRDILFDPQDHYDETNPIMTTKSFCQCPSSQLQPIPFPVLSKQHDIMACYYYNDDKEEETITFYNHKLKQQQPQSLERTKLIGTKRRLYHQHHHQKSLSTLSPSLCYPLQHQDNYGLSSNLTCMAFDKQGTSFIYGLDNGDLFLYQGIK